MRKIVLILSLVALTLSNVFAEKKNEVKEYSNSTDVIRVAFLGVDINNLRSNYLGDDVIAEKFSADEDSINVAFNQDFFEALRKNGSKKGKYDFVYCCHTNNKNFLDRITYKEEGDEMYSDISEITQEDFNAVIDNAHADFMVLIDQYYIKKEGYPYHNYSHIINYSVFNKDKIKVSKGCYRFTSIEMEKLDDYSKQFMKAADKLVAKIEK